MCASRSTWVQWTDLSRRCRPYDMSGLSFREFLKFYKGMDVTEKVEALIYTHNANDNEGATLTTYKSESVEYK